VARYPLGPCDRHPSALAQTAWYNAQIRGVIELCAHDATIHWVELMAQGFELSIDNRAELIQDRLQGDL
jgi:hypothetical protein